MAKKEVKKAGLLSRIKAFFSGVKAELKKVRWANKKEFIKYTGATIFFIIFFALFFAATDTLIYLLKQLVR